MTPSEQSARAYCQSIGADPDEIVERWWGYARGGGYFTSAPRWMFYIGAKIEHKHAAE